MFGKYWLKNNYLPEKVARYLSYAYEIIAGNRTQIKKNITQKINPNLENLKKMGQLIITG